ncbi:hypothetical protein [Pseudomonas syringae]|uniref:hypothetical protein n=1 Tax=Pseudomonas syringae TaxID=317 RepID=UPI001F0FFDC1|nr:hypothetical protein [Pseudomonas syringae]MCH5490484.1 hypothetical protein [Pseudomonas syringae pv. syringae]MDO1461017.1 hypothetical protein [Pseudomonas syringae pv. syringae]
MKFKYLLLACLLMTGRAMAEADLSEQYPGPWLEKFDQRISKTLAVNGIRGCGQYKFKEDAKQSKSYIVYCSRDGENWLAYIVWAASEKVMGPYAPDSSLN